MPISRRSSAIIRPAFPPTTASAPPPLLPLDVSGPLDNAEREFLWRWRRMHRRHRGPFFAAETKRVSWDQTEAEAQRFVWEVAQLRHGDALAWVFLCWSIDTPIGVWWKEFPDESGARNYFAQPPASVIKAVVKATADRQ